MIFLFFISRISAIQYCITTNVSNSCYCRNYTEVYPEIFNEETILNESMVELYFCTDFNKKLNVSNINQQLILNSARKINLLLNLSLAPRSISLTFQNVNVSVENYNSGTFNLNYLYLFQTNFRMSNNRKFLLVSKQFTTDYNGYYEFDSVITDNLRILKYDLWEHQNNPIIDIKPNDALNQHIALEILNDCYIEFQNYSVTFINNFTLTINVKSKARIDLYVTGTHYIFFSMYYIYGDNFIPVNIYNLITIPDRIRLRLNYTGFYGRSISPDRYMTVTQFPSSITVEGHIQNVDIPLTFPLYANSILILNENNTSIQGSVIASAPNGQITTILANQVHFEAYSIERLGGTSGTIQCNPLIDFVLEMFTNHAYISGQRSTISFRNLYTSPGFGYHTNLALNTNIYENVMIGSNGISNNLIEGSFTFPEGEKHIHVTFDSSIASDIYFNRYMKSDALPLLCNKFYFDCNEWFVDLKTNTQQYNEVFPFAFNKQCFINSLKSIQCLSIQFDQSSESNVMNQDIYIGNNVINRSYNSLLSDETQLISNFLEVSVNIIKIQIGDETTIDLSTFKEYSAVIIRGIDATNSKLNLIVADINRSINLHLLVIDTCNINFIGTYIQADKIVFYNCLVADLTIDLNTNDLSVPFSLLSNEKIISKQFSSLTIFSIENSLSMNFSPNNVIINAVSILYDNFGTLCIYPMSRNAMTVVYNQVDNAVSVKGISLNFSNYYVEDVYVINKPAQTQTVTFNFTGFWNSVTSLITPFRFDLSGVTTTLPQIPSIFGLDVGFSGGNIVFNSAQPISIQNPLYLKQNTNIDSQTMNFLLSHVNIDRSIGFTSRKIVSIQSLNVERDVFVSLNPISSEIASLTMNTRSQINSQVLLQVNSATYYFNLESIPMVTANPLLISQLNLNFINSTDSKPSNFIGIRHNILCGLNVTCLELQSIVKFNSNVDGVGSDIINDAYQTKCTDPDSTNKICIYAYLDKDINLILNVQEKSTKIKPWVIAIAVLIPLIVIILIIVIVILVLMKKQKKKEEQNRSSETLPSENEADISAVQTPRKRRIQAPIPPRKAVRWSPKRARYIYNSNSEDQSSIKSETKPEISNQLSPSQKPNERIQFDQDPEKDSYQSESTNHSDDF